MQVSARRASLNSAPYHLIKHWPFYRAIAIAVVVVAAVALWINTQVTWYYPVFSIAGFPLLVAGVATALSAFWSKPVGVPMNTRLRDIWYSEWIYVTQHGEQLTLVQLSGITYNPQRTTKWRDIRSSLTMGGGLLAVLGVLCTIVGAGYLNNPM